MDHKDNLVVEMNNIRKAFPGVQALKGVNFDLRKGEVHALVGENGAGKSTLIKILSGAIPQDEGDIYLNGKKVLIRSPSHAHKLGISTIYQEFTLNPHMDIVDNIFLGKELRKSLFVDKTKEIQETKILIERIGFDLDPGAVVRNLNVASKQMVEIIKALNSSIKILILDEPTSALTDKEIITLFEVIRRLKEQGIGIIYISHRLQELRFIADRGSVLRDGRGMGTIDVTQDLDVNEFVALMVGRAIKEIYPQVEYRQGMRKLLEVNGLTKEQYLKNISFSLSEGEILGMFGLVGCGKEELSRCIFGADDYRSGKIEIVNEKGERKKLRKLDVQKSLKNGLYYLPSDRIKEGIVECLPVKENITLGSLRSFSSILGFMKSRLELVKIKSLIEKLRIRPQSPNTISSALSGGNKQKLVIAKALCTGAKVFFFCEPTRGIDVNAKTEIYKIISQLIEEKGSAVVLVSSELPELLGMCTRILVMYDGSIVKELSRHEFDEEKIMIAACGGI